MSTGVFRENIEYFVKVALTDPERLALGGELAQAYSDRADLERDKKLQADGIKRLIEVQDAVITRNGELLQRGYQEHEMECERIKDYGANTLTIYRLDNSEVVTQRELTEDEQQMEISDEPEFEVVEDDTESDVPDPPDLDTSEMDGDPEGATE